jgi:two-component system OmpR family response regulator
MTRLLHIDDESDIREVVKVSLELVGGFEVDLAVSGAEGLVKARNQKPDIILLDIMMPGLDGPATLRALREDPQTSEIPAIFMTAKVQVHEVAQFMALGALGVIPKPFDPMTLPDQIRSLWKPAQKPI